MREHPASGPRPGPNVDGAAVLADVARGLEASGANMPGLSWVEVDAIPRTGTGKAPPHSHHRRTPI